MAVVTAGSEKEEAKRKKARWPWAPHPEWRDPGPATAPDSARPPPGLSTKSGSARPGILCTVLWHGEGRAHADDV